LILDSVTAYEAVTVISPLPNNILLLLY